MSEITSGKATAIVFRCVDLANVLPGSSPRGRLGFDVRVTTGTLSVGQRVKVLGSGSQEEIEIIGIEVLGDRHDPHVVRVHCTKPQAVVVRTGSIEGWTMVEA
jgi:translation elongation factor EF-G